MSPQLSNAQLTQVAKQFGTPVYAYHAEAIAYQYQQLVNAFAQTNVLFFYACKALTNISVLRYVKKLGAGVDCSSINEVKLALYAGFDPASVLYTSNGIHFDEIVAAKQLGVRINIDSLSNLQKFGAAFGHSYPVSVRLRPNILAGGNLKISTGHDKSKFGIPVEQVEQLINIVQQHNLFIRGLHIHTGSEIKDVEVFVKGSQVLFDLIPRFSEIEFLDLGGGFKVPYNEGDPETNMVLLGQKVQEAVDNFTRPSGKKLQIWFEPGKYMVSNAGYFITKVNVLKPTGATHFASIDSGFNHLIRPMFYDAYHRIVNITNPEGPVKNYSVVGNICETDTFAWERELNEIREDDLLVFYNAGAYGFEMSSNFNSRYKPAEVLMLNNQPHLIRARDQFADLLRNQVEIAI